MEPTLEQQLRTAGLKATAGRLAVLTELESSAHKSAEQILKAVASLVPTTSIQSVHNILTDLTSAGLIRRIEPAGSAGLYERRIGDNHHHVVCTSCGAVADVDCTVGHAPCLAPRSSGGFTVQTAEVTYWGLCPACQVAQQSDSRPTQMSRDLVAAPK